MKKSFTVLVLITAFMGCGGPETDIAGSKPGSDSLLAVNTEHVSPAAPGTESLREIRMYLDSIRRASGEVYSRVSEPVNTVPEELTIRIKGLNRMVRNYQARAERLNERLRAASEINGELRDSITSLNSVLATRSEELEALNIYVVNAFADFEVVESVLYTLYLQNAVQDLIIHSNAESAHTAYYRVGREKDLIAEGLLERNRGVLGLRQPARLSEGLTTSKCVRVDDRKAKIIPVNGRNIRVVSTHPASSYRLNMDGKLVRSLEILDADAFWRLSRYLVITRQERPAN